MNPEAWLANFESEIADLKQKAATFQENLERSNVSVPSKDGRISVSVAPNGALTDLRIDADPSLAAEIMKLARQAQRQAAVKVVDAVTPLGADSEALHMIIGYVPPEEPEEPAPSNTYQFDVEEREPSSPPQPIRRPAPPNDDEDYGYRPDTGRW